MIIRMWITASIGFPERHAEAPSAAGGAKGDDSYEDGGFQASKTRTATRMATPRGPIPVTDAF